MPSRPACLVLGMGIGALIQPAIVASEWVLWQIQSRPARTR